MIQRIQTVFQALAIIALTVFLFVPIWSKTSPDKTKHTVLDAWARTEYSATTNTLNNTVVSTEANWYIGASAVLGALILLYSITQYKNRLMQMKLGIGFSLTILVTGVTTFLGVRMAEGATDPNFIGFNEVGLYLPFVALFLNMAANRFIRKDEQLVRSMDRLR
jgi:phosphatidylserine synthase